MNKIVVFLFASFFLMHCDDDDKSSRCSTPATIRDFSSLDACGFVFELENGTILEPFRLIVCLDSKSPTTMTEEDPFGDIEPEDGRKVFIDYEVVEGATACMAGQTVKITCITDRVTVADR